MNKLSTSVFALSLVVLPVVRAVADACYVDVLFALDKKAVEYLTDTRGTNVSDYVAQQLVIMNQVLENSGLADKFQFRSAGTYELGFEAKQVDTSKELTRDVLENATAGKGMWEDLHTERDNRGADVVSVLIDTGSEYGHAGDGNSLTDLSKASSFGENAYSVVSVRSTFNYYAIIHEIGHNLGAGHALETSTADQSTAYSHGYNFTVDGQGYYTVMGYANNSAVPPTKAIPYFSTPDKAYLGVAVGTAERQDNVRVIEQTYEAASQWRTAPSKSHPTMSVAWNQVSPMNDFSAMAQKNGSWQKAPCGCAATAAAQMFKHYAWPIRTDSVMEGAAHKYIDDTSYPFTLRVDGHNDFQWSKMQNNAGDNDVVGDFETARMVLWCDAMAGMDFRVGDSSAQFDDIAENATQWFKKGKSTYYSEGDAYWEALTNALDRGELVQFTFTTHQVVADGYKVEEDTLKVHLNYGWADSSTRWYTKSELIGLGLNYIWTGFVPKKMAQLKPLPKQVSGSVPLSWTVPAQYADELTGFSLMGYCPGTTLTSYTGETGTMAADRAGTYFLTGAFGITANSTITYTLNSYHTQGSKVELQARFDAGEWETIATPAISTIEDSVDKSTGKTISGWLATTETVNLGSHANTTGEFRFKVSRTSKARSKDGQLTFAKPVWANVYSPVALTMGLPGYKTLRSYSFPASSYAGKVISFTAEPIIAGSVVCEPVATKVVSASVPAQPAIVSIDGLSSEIENDFQRTCGIGKSVFFVKANATTTAITASSSHLALVGDNGIAVTKVNDDTWAVIIDATGTPASSQLILTLIAEDALGNKAYKDLQLTFQSGEGGAEQEDTLAEKIAGGNFLYVPEDMSVTLPSDDGRYVAGRGTVVFDGGMPSVGVERGFNNPDSWKGKVKFINFTPTAEEQIRINYEFVNDNSTVQIGDDPEPDPNEMYHNTLSAGNEDVKVARGTYGDIEVPSVGYYATAFDATTTLATSGTSIGGSYADIIIKNGQDNDTRQHTFLGWFCVSDLSAERILWFAYANGTASSSDNGYKVCVTTDGKIKIVKTNKGALDNGTALYSSDAVMTAGTWAHIAVAFEWGGSGNRKLTPTLFVNGVQQTLTGGTTIGSNLNGNTGAIVQIGAGVTAAGIYVDTTALSDAAKVASFATNEYYLTKGKKEMPVPETLTKMEIGFYTPENNKLGVVYMLDGNTWTNEFAVVSDENFWRDASNTSVDGKTAAVLVYYTPSGKGQTLLAGGKGLNPNANLGAVGKYWQVAIPLLIPSGYTYTLKSAVPHLCTLNNACAQQTSNAACDYSAAVEVGGISTGEIHTDSIYGTMVTTNSGTFATSVTLSGENTLKLKMFVGENCSRKGTYTGATGIDLYGIISARALEGSVWYLE